MSDKERCQRLLRDTPPGSGLTGDDFSFVYNLLLRHPSVDEKVGAGVARITVEKRRYGTHGFVVHRMDGTWDDFSYLKCLHGESSHRQDALSALRREVETQIHRFRETKLAAGQTHCPLTGEELTGGNTHVHHAFSKFVQIADRFARSEGGFDAIATVDATDGGRQLADREQAKRWRAFHESTAKLRLVSKWANLSLLETNPELDERLG